MSEPDRSHTHPNGRHYDEVRDWPKTPARTHAEIFAVQDDCLVAMSSATPKVHVHQIRRLPPWRAVMIARIAWKAGLLQRRDLDAMVREAQLVGGTGELKNP